jgi:hypothetical protein
MQPRLLPKTLLLVLASCLAAWTSPAAAKVFAPDGQGFSVNMPGKPTETETTHKSFVGAVQETSYSVKNGGATYTASVSNLPGMAVALGGAGTILGKAKDGLLKESGGTETSFTDVKLGKYEGRVLNYSLASGGAAIARLYLVEKRLYVIVGSGPAAAAAAIQRFVNSFQLTSP